MIQKAKILIQQFANPAVKLLENNTVVCIFMKYRLKPAIQRGLFGSIPKKFWKQPELTFPSAEFAT